MSDPRILSSTTIDASVDERDRLRLDARISSDPGNALLIGSTATGLARTRGWPYFQAFALVNHAGVTYEPVFVYANGSGADPAGILASGKVVLDEPGIWFLNVWVTIVTVGAVTSGGFGWDVQQPAVWAGGQQSVGGSGTAWVPIRCSSIVRVGVGEVVTLTPLVYVSAARLIQFAGEGVRLCPVLEGVGA